MSTLTYDYSPNNITEDDIRRIAREEQGRKAHVAVHNPKTGNWHVATTNPKYPTDTYFKDLWKNGAVIANSRIAYEGHKRLAAGHLSAAEIDHYKYNPYRPEFQDKALRVNELLEKVDNGVIGHHEAAGIIANSDYQELINQVFAQEMLDLEIREYVLENAATRINADTLVVPLPDMIEGAKPVAKGLREFDIPDPFAIKYEVEEISLQKSAARFEISTWFDLSNRRRNVEADTRQYIELDWPRIYDEEIRDRLAEFPEEDVGGAFDAFDPANFHYDVDPTLVFEDFITSLTDNGAKVNTAVMHPRTLRVLSSNSYMRDATPATALPIGQADVEGRSTTLAKLQGIQIYTSRAITVGKIHFYDKRTVKDIRGPTRSGNYEEILGSYRGTLIERWYGSANQNLDWGVTLTDTITVPSPPPSP